LETDPAAPIILLLPLHHPAPIGPGTLIPTGYKLS
jgi:hypothetical protein